MRKTVLTEQVFFPDYYLGMIFGIFKGVWRLVQNAECYCIY